MPPAPSSGCRLDQVHLSHSYRGGGCLSFTSAFVHDGVDPLAHYDDVKPAVQQAFIDNGGTLSHRRGVGRGHRPWLEQGIRPAASAS